MVKEFMELRRIQTDLGEILDRLEYGVVNGIKTPVDAKIVAVKLEKPESCSLCFLNPICIKMDYFSEWCGNVWENLIHHHSKKYCA